LEQRGVLENNPILRDGIMGLLDRWMASPKVTAFTPTLTHGDTTPSNFVSALSGELVALDWEYMSVQDPAVDLGYLMADLTQSITQYRGNVADAMPLVRRLTDAYCRALPPTVDAEALLERARFYQALNMLRIARNEWLSPFESMRLVAQAIIRLIS
jgi:aminoglycoside phosphotransferase (APT) family kinase protein